MKIIPQIYDQPQEIKDIGKQVFRLVVPNLNPLISLLMECMAGVQSRRKEVSIKRDRIAEEGITAAARLMQPTEQEQRLHNEPYFSRIEKL